MGSARKGTKVEVKPKGADPGGDRGKSNVTASLFSLRGSAAYKGWLDKIERASGASSRASMVEMALTRQARAVGVVDVPPPRFEPSARSNGRTA